MLGMPDIELLGILKIMCNLVGKQADRKFDFRTMEPSTALSCKVNTNWISRSDNVDVINIISSMPHYFRSSIDREAYKRAS